MKIEQLSAEVAFSNLRENIFSKWPLPENATRILPLASPTTPSRFHVLKSDKIFCIGSCFAREIEQVFKSLNFDVLSIIRNLPKTPQRNIADAGMFNKYTVSSMLNELKWALNKRSRYNEGKVLVDIGEGKVEDYQLAGEKYSESVENMRAFRKAFNKSFAEIKKADIVVLTLGLSEAWFDKKSNIYLNVAPTAAAVDKHPGRFELHVLGYEETLRALKDCYEVLSKNVDNKNFKILVTVSPVPLSATFRQQDVLTANCYSKSVLRAAVEKFVAEYSNVYYFPAYEFATLSNPLCVWSKNDLIHVSREFVDYVIGSVLEGSMPQSQELTDLAILGKSSAMYRGGFFKEAAELLADALKGSTDNRNSKLLLRLAMSYRKQKKWHEAISWYERYLSIEPEDKIASNVLLEVKEKVVKKPALAIA